MKTIDGDNTDVRKWKWWMLEIAPESLKELNESERRYARSLNHWFLVWGFIFFGVVLFMKPLSGGIESTSVWRLLLAFSPVVATTFLIRAYIRFYCATKDELIRKVHYESLGIGFAVAFLVGICFAASATVVGNSERAGVITWSVMLLAYFISQFRMYRKYDV